MNLTIAEELGRRFEGLHRVGSDGLIYPYICPAGYATQGYGTVWRPDGKQVTMSDPSITKEQAYEWLVWGLMNTYAPGVIRLCPGLYAQAVAQNSWGRFNAIVDFAFNLGVGRLQTSTLRRRINEQDWPGVKVELMRWVRGGGVVLPGLVKRRQAEAMFF